MNALREYAEMIRGAVLYPSPSMRVVHAFLVVGLALSVLRCAL